MYNQNSKLKHARLDEQGVKSGMLAKRIFLPVCNLFDVLNLTYFGNSRSLAKISQQFFSEEKM